MPPPETKIFNNIKKKNLAKKLNYSRKKIIKKFSSYQEEKYIIKMINKIKNIR